MHLQSGEIELEQRLSDLVDNVIVTLVPRNATQALKQTREFSALSVFIQNEIWNRIYQDTFALYSRTINGSGRVLLNTNAQRAFSPDSVSRQWFEITFNDTFNSGFFGEIESSTREFFLNGLLDIAAEFSQSVIPDCWREHLDAREDRNTGGTDHLNPSDMMHHFAELIQQILNNQDSFSSHTVKFAKSHDERFRRYFGDWYDELKRSNVRSTGQRKKINSRKSLSPSRAQRIKAYNEQKRRKQTN